MKPIAFFLFVAALFLTGCTTDSRTGKQYGVSEDKSEIFHVYVDLIIKQDDALCLYYTTDGNSYFSQSATVWREVKGNTKKQQIDFVLPEKVRPTQLRLDLGRNSKQPDIYLKKIALAFKGKTVEFPGTVVFSYFMPDVTKTKFNATTGLIQGEIKKGVRQSPSLYPKDDSLEEELEKLVE